MKKAESLRRHLEQMVPALVKAPDSLHVFVEKGSIAARHGSTSFEYRYDINLVITDFGAPADTLIIPLMVWIQTNQVDLLLHPDKMDSIIKFEAEILDHDKADLSLTLPVTESVSVSQPSPGHWLATHREEPPMPEVDGPTGWTLQAGDEIFTA